MNKKWLLLFIATYIPLSNAYTLVYNMRIRRAFSVPQDLLPSKKPVLLSFLPIYSGRRSHIVREESGVDVHENRNVVGSLFNVRYVPSRNWWVEATTGLEQDRSSFDGTDTFSATRTGFDDFLFIAGYRHFIKKKTQLVAYGLGGLPAGRTLRKDDRFGPLVGSRFYGAGFGTEASYAFIDTKEHTLTGVIQQRFVHFFDRHWFPIFPPCDIIVPGNFTDILVALMYRKRTTTYQLGFNPTFFTNQAVITPIARTPVSTSPRYGAYFNALHLIRRTMNNERRPIIIGGGVNASASKTVNLRTFSTWIGLIIEF